MIDPGTPDEARRTAFQAIWTFPSVVASAFIVAWGAEAAQFFVSQGLALALLAWIQVLPEFAVEAVIAWERDVPLMTANFTGALRLLTGLGWPTIYIVHAVTRHLQKDRRRLPRIDLDPEHAAEVVGLVAPLLYFVWIIVKGSLGVFDAMVLFGLYIGYLTLLHRLPPKQPEELEDAPPLVRRIVRLPRGQRIFTIAGLFIGGGLLLFFAAHPFLHSMIGLATLAGVSQFVFVQWVAPFLSELPEFLSTTNWARQRGKAGMALMNMASSNVNQWTVLAAMIPVVYSLSLGHAAHVPLAGHRLELALTWLQGMLGIVILSNLTFEAYEAAGLFILWFAQFLVPHWREEVCVAYAVWLMVELVSTFWRPGRLRAFREFMRLWRSDGHAKPAP